MVAMDDWTVDDLEALVRRAAPFAELPRSALDSVLDMLSGRYPRTSSPSCGPGSTGTGSRAGWPAAPAPSAWPSPPAAPSPTGACSASSWSGSGPPGSASWTRRWSTSPGSARCSPSAPRPGGSRTSPTTGCWSPRPRPAGQAAVLARRHAGPPGRAGPRPRRVPARAVRPDPGGAAGAAAGRRPGRLRRRQPRRLPGRAARGHRGPARRPHHRGRALPRRAGRLAGLRPLAVRGPGPRPWSQAIEARVRERLGLEVQTMYTDDGVVVRLPEVDEAPAAESILFDPDEIEDLVVGEVGSALFASRFRECAARALLLPRRRPDRRTPVAAAPAQRRPAPGRLQVRVVPGGAGDDARVPPGRVRPARPQGADGQGGQPGGPGGRGRHPFPSPFASSLQFGYVAAFMYEGDAPWPSGGPRRCRWTGRSWPSCWAARSCAT